MKRRGNEKIHVKRKDERSKKTEKIRVRKGREGKAGPVWDVRGKEKTEGGGG